MCTSSLQVIHQVTAHVLFFIYYESVRNLHLCALQTASCPAWLPPSCTFFAAWHAAVHKAMHCRYLLSWLVRYIWYALKALCYYITINDIRVRNKSYWFSFQSYGRGCIMGTSHSCLIFCDLPLCIWHGVKIEPCVCVCFRFVYDRSSANPSSRTTRPASNGRTTQLRRSEERTLLSCHFLGQEAHACTYMLGSTQYPDRIRTVATLALVLCRVRFDAYSTSPLYPCR